MVAGISVEVTNMAAADREHTFAVIVPIDLRKIFRGYGPLAAIIGTRDQTGDWDGVGQSRRIMLSDGSSVTEELIQYDRPSFFSYVIRDISGPLRLLAREAGGEWWFAEDGQGHTTVRWRYTFYPRYHLAYPLVWMVAKCLWVRYMGVALAGAIAEAQRVPPG